MAFDERVGQLWVEISAKKGNVADAFKAVREDYDATTKKAQAYTAFMATGQGQEAARALVQSQAAASWSKLVAEQGRSGAVLSTIGGKLKGIKGHLDSIGNMPMIGFAAASAAMSGLAAAASPAVWSTFTGSWTYLSAVVGQMFVPYMIEAARAIQAGARWFQTLDPELRSNAAGWIVAGVAAMGFVSILSRMLSLVLSLGPALRALGFLAATPVGAALAGAALGGGTAYAVGEASLRYGARAQPRTLQTLPPIGDMQRGTGMFHALLSRIFTVNPLTNIRTGYEEFQRQTQPQSSLRDALNATPRATPAQMATPITAQGTWAGMTGQTGMWSRPGVLNPLRVNADMSMMDGPRRPAQARPGAADPFLQNIPFQSQTFGIEDASRRLQQHAASMSPLQAEIQRVQFQGMDELVNGVSERGPIARFLANIQAALERMPGGLGG